MVKKIIPLLLVLVTISSVLPLRGDTPPNRPAEIPIRKPGAHDLVRSLCEIQAYYDGMLSVVHTAITSNLGDVDVIVTNCSTGEFWEDSFDSSSVSQHLLPISSTSGRYEVVYTTENGDSYVGTFVIESNL